MERLESTVTGRGALVSVTVPLSAIAPAVALGRAEGDVRGFWARGDRWVAHWGAVDVVRLEPGEGVEGRFLEVRDRARRVFERVEPSGSVTSDLLRPPRFYGGFSFQDGPARDDPTWHPFGSAAFVLPEVEIAGREESARLTMRAHAAVTPADELHRRARRLADALARPEGRAGSRGEGGSGTLAEQEKEVGVDPAARPRRAEEMDPGAWRAAVEEAVSWIRNGRLSKVVLARTLDVLGPVLPDPADVVLSLREQNPGTHVFYFQPVPGSALVGAAPETIGTALGGSFRATAVAGSISRGGTPAEQEALALRLLESEKDREEHAIALDDMVRRLGPLAEELSWDAEPHVLTLSRIQHLESHIQARLAQGVSILEILDALHPTPAVCGLPRDRALEFLTMEEPFERGWYAGPVGWFNEEGEGVFAPALRCAVLTRGRWRLFAGAGIVSGSDADLEWEETRIKFEPVVRALEAAAGFPRPESASPGSAARSADPGSSAEGAEG